MIFNSYYNYILLCISLSRLQAAREKRGEKSDKAKPLKGLGGASILEIVEDNLSNTYRAIHTVKFKEAIAVLHIFQKKSKHGIATPKQEIDLVKSRFKAAEQQYEVWLLEQQGNSDENKKNIARGKNRR